MNNVRQQALRTARSDPTDRELRKYPDAALAEIAEAYEADDTTSAQQGTHASGVEFRLDK
ncbi:MAG: hypothetical protein WAT70_07510 [Rhizobiaceae bacterium]